MSPNASASLFSFRPTIVLLTSTRSKYLQTDTHKHRNHIRTGRQPPRAQHQPQQHRLPSHLHPCHNRSNPRRILSVAHPVFLPPAPSTQPPLQILRRLCLRLNSQHKRSHSKEQCHSFLLVSRWPPVRRHKHRHNNLDHNHNNRWLNHPSSSLRVFWQRLQDTGHPARFLHRG